jgi:BlaI family transcriptional regulator, penicillinase repressor
MPPRPGLSKAELEIARIVWELKDASVRQVFEALPAGRDIDFTTVGLRKKDISTHGLKDAIGFTHLRFGLKR